jgi:hypothetical protein
MIIDFETKLKQIDGTELDGTVRELAVQALLATYPNEGEIGGDEKEKRYLLAVAINGGHNEITPEQASLLKRLIGIAYQPLFVGQAYAVLNG